jgi:hypothetical protein
MFKFEVILRGDETNMIHLQEKKSQKEDQKLRSERNS